MARKKRVKPFNKKNLPTLIRLYKKGWTIKALMDKWSCYGNVLVRLLVKAGVYRKSCLSATPEYCTFLSLRWRCARPGGRIKLLFKSFDQFVNEVGLRPSSTKYRYRLQMIDRNKHYAPGNVRWTLQHFKSHTPEYVSYVAAKYRCTEPKCISWENYGGRGIQFRFASFEEFLAELGPKPGPEHSLDRIDNDGNYEVGNVRWATPLEQVHNRRCSIKDVDEGEIYEAP